VIGRRWNRIRRRFSAWWTQWTTQPEPQTATPSSETRSKEASSLDPAGGRETSPHGRRVTLGPARGEAATTRADSRTNSSSTNRPDTQAAESPIDLGISARAPISPMRPTDGKRSVWLWTQDGKVHACLDFTAQATERRLSPAEIALLLLADPARTMPAILSITGTADPHEAVAYLRTWQPRTVVSLDAAVLAGRQVPKALQKPSRPNLDGTVRTVSGGLPSLNKRRR
jgi:hypothetical protein